MIAGRTRSRSGNRLIAGIAIGLTGLRVALLGLGRLPDALTGRAAIIAQALSSLISSTTSGAEMGSLWFWLEIGDWMN